MNGKLKPKGERAWVLKAHDTSDNKQEILAIRLSDVQLSQQFAAKFHQIFPPQQGMPSPMNVNVHAQGVGYPQSPPQNYFNHPQFPPQQGQMPMNNMMAGGMMNGMMGGAPMMGGGMIMAGNGAMMGGAPMMYNPAPAA
eukprot:171059_1